MDLLLKYKYLFLGLILVLFPLLPLLQKGLPPTHDGEYNVIRYYEFSRAIQGGDWYPRWAQDLNYGYGVPIFNFIYLFPSIIAFFLHTLSGISFIDSFKLNMFFASLVGAIFYYLWAKEYWGKLGGMVSSIYYLYAPYHFLDIYIRGSAGEVWALGLFPAFLWSFNKSITGSTFYLGISSLVLGLIIFSHNILALMFFPFVVSYIVYSAFSQQKKWIVIFRSFTILVLGLGISAIFWLPALIEKQYTVGLQLYSFKNHFPELYELLIPSWGSGFSGASLEGKMSFQIGIANLFVVFLSLISFPFLRKNRSVLLFFISWFCIVIFLMLKISIPVWDTIPLMEYFQYPWRFLSLAIVTSSFLAGSICVLGKRMFIKVFLACFLMLISILLSIGYAKPAHYFMREDMYYITRPNFIDGTNYTGNTFNTKWAKGIDKRSKKKLEFVLGKGSIQEQLMMNSKYKFAINVMTQNAILKVNTVYFPGWTVFIDGKQSTIHINNIGAMEINVSSGKHIIDVMLFETSIQFISKMVSLISLVLTVVFLSGRKIRRYI